MRAIIRAADGAEFHLCWADGRVVSNSDSEIALSCLDYLNGTPTLYLGEPNPGGTDGHYTEERALRDEMEFLLIVGSLFDRFGVRVELAGELADADHEEILNNPAADAAIAEMAIERAVADGMSRAMAVELYGAQRRLEFRDSRFLACRSS